MNHFADTVDTMDSAVFSGDGLYDKNNMQLFEEALARWGREVAVIKKLVAEEDAENE